ncbi:ArsB/NhaD family transporter [Thermodesulfobacterium sp.]|jgi:Na+/H+ antiporter NhaD/arsenite permease-like protein|uniref:Citrate transporter n=1 Tax=Thermodesulfobacterium commune TaxID=1741 RepID=A0A3B8N2Y9_9BACT|nr:ArsB/NhaD family transporter [Thermodesulfobacterium sp.]MBZ4681234.1 citrate transporter [Thermodesulfobacterium sp.]HAA83530.1 citrate transporter [Thermodesulfobacterium commune]HBT03601.1 citrate transporter [Thermodesulfobacterium commune]HCP09342.1 citrate transporter [Thermodesulfobacterium commune]
MKKTFFLFALFILILPFLVFAEDNSQQNMDKIHISGIILDNHKEPVKEAEIKLLVDGKPYKILKEHGKLDKVISSSQGTFQLDFQLPKGLIETGKIQLEIAKTSFKKTVVEIKKEDFAVKGNEFYANKNIILERYIGPAFWIATIVFVVTYALISFELLHRTVAAMLGAATILILTYTLGTINSDFHIISFERAIEAIDMNVIFLLMGMMVIIGVLKHTGVFQWCAYMSYKLARGNVMVLSIISFFFIAITSAFLDNVTAMLLYTPVLIEISIALKINPLSLLIPGIMASNVGGTATLIGDPPNIMIGSYTGLTFMQFVYALTPVVLICMIALVIYNKFFYSKEYKKGKVDDVDAFLSYLREEYKITDKTLLTYGLIVMLIVIGFFATHGYWHMEVSIPALFGAGILFTYAVLTKKVKMLELIEKDIEWTTLLFFIFLFIIVGAVEEVGLLAIIADWVHNLSAGNLTVAICLILWVSAIMSAFVDNIPFTATMLPIVAYLTKVIPGAESNVLWWALALGACLGGNGTMIGASANVVTIGIAESAGYKISFFGFMKYAFVYMLITIIISNIWLLLFY